MRGHVKRRCPSPKVGRQRCSGNNCGHPWAFWIDLPRREDGRRRQTSRGGFATKREAQTALTALLASVNERTFTEPHTITVGAYLTTWIDGLDRKPATIEAYRRAVLRHLVPALGHGRLQNLTPPQLKAAYRALLDDKRLSASTVQLGRVSLL